MIAIVGAFICVFILVRFCMHQICVRGVCFVTNWYKAAAQQQQQYNGSRVSSYCLCASSHGVYVWLVHSRRTNHDNLFTSNAIIKHISADLIPGTHEAYSTNKTSTSCMSLERVCSPFRLATPPRYQQPHPTGEPCNKQETA